MVMHAALFRAHPVLPHFARRGTPIGGVRRQQAGETGGWALAEHAARLESVERGVLLVTSVVTAAWRAHRRAGGWSRGRMGPGRATDLNSSRKWRKVGA